MRIIDRVGIASVIILLVSSLIAVSALMSISRKKLDAQTARHQLLIQRDSIAKRVSEIHYLEEKHQKFKQLTESKVSNAQRRVSRAELIDKATSDLDLPSVTFVMHPFRPLFDTDTEGPVAGYEETEIELRLIHDTQLVAFLEYLNKHATENMFASVLEVKRISENSTAAETAEQINLLVNCTIRWISYQRRNGDAAVG